MRSHVHAVITFGNTGKASIQLYQPANVSSPTI